MTKQPPTKAQAGKRLRTWRELADALTASRTKVHSDTVRRWHRQGHMAQEVANGRLKFDQQRAPSITERNLLRWYDRWMAQRAREAEADQAARGGGKS